MTTSDPWRTGGREAGAGSGGTVLYIDLAARYGGEEFAVILPGSDVAGARTVADRLCAAVAELNEPHALTECGFVTVSVGLAAVTPRQDLTADLLIEAADEQLYRAKRDGRNRVMGPNSLEFSRAP